MAFNFNCGQFNAERRPKALCNWEVPRWAPTRPRPAEMRPPCKPIVDDRGHFLPGVPRGTSRCFGNYAGTWDLPRRITRELAEELSRQPPPGRYKDWLQPRVQRPKAAAAAAARLRGKKHGTKKARDTHSDDKFEDGLLAQETEKSCVDEHHTERNNEEEEKEREETNQDKECDLFDAENKKEPVDKDGHGPYIPGSETEPQKRHDSYNLLERNAIEEIHGPQEDVVDKFWKKVAENAKKNELQEKDVDGMKKDKENFKLPIVNVAQNFEFARKMRVGNLEHQPLPDTMGYRNLTKIGEHRDSDIVVKPYAIGWKGYGASGPTCCTKMRVHRPKTCDAKKSESVQENKLRPSTSAPDLGRKYKKPMSLMDLAICWDYRPDDPQQEPRPPKHVDGSNGSKAPAVFTMVHTPKDDVEEITRSGHSNPIFNQNRVVEDAGHHPVPYFEKDVTKEKRKESCDVQYCSQHNKVKNNQNKRDSKSGSDTRRNSVQSNPKAECDGIHGCGTPKENSRKSSRDHSARNEKLAQIKEAWSDNNYDLNRNRPSLESYDKTSLAQGKLHQSSPNDSKLSRSSKDNIVSNNNEKHKYCTSCNTNNKTQVEAKHKEDYKFAFKAGNPNSIQNSNSNDSKNFKIPKLRHPYSKKSYSIPTLAPPFSVWKDASSSGYPEHWRLASIYQHAYKPPEQRRKPLIASIYE